MNLTFDLPSHLTEKFAREERATLVCETHGEYVSRLFFDQSDQQVWKFPSKCLRCQEAEREAREEALAEKKRIEKLQQRIEAAEIPLRFKDATLESFERNAGNERQVHQVRAYADLLISGRDEGRCLILLGAPGLGKTHLAIATLSVVIEAGSTGRYTTVAEMIRRIRYSWKTSSSESEIDVLRGYSNVGLLVLDEVGTAQSGSDSELGLLGEIIDARYRFQLPTIAIGNVTAKELGRCIGERALDRFRDNGGQAIQFTGSSYRLRKAGSK